MRVNRAFTLQSTHVLAASTEGPVGGESSELEVELELIVVFWPRAQPLDVCCSTPMCVAAPQTLGGLSGCYEAVEPLRVFYNCRSSTFLP